MTAVTGQSLRATGGFLLFTQSTVFATVLLALILATPSGVSYIFITSSQAAGTAVMAGVAAFLLAPVVRVRLRLLAIAVLATVIVAHFFVARSILPPDTTRFASSFALLMAMVVAAHFVAPWLLSLPDPVLRATMNALRIGMVVVALFSLIGIEPTRWDYSIPEKAIFPFTEHSHFALVFTPLLLEGCARGRGLARPAWLVVGLLVALLLQNLTILVGVALVALVTAPAWQFLILLAGAAAAASTMDLSYYLSRLDLSTGTNNLSALVYIQGQDFIRDSLALTGDWGLGFQQLGVIPLNSPASNVIYQLTGGESLNINDGGFGASKVISEFGLFGAAACLYYAGIVAVFVRRLRRVALTGVGQDAATAVIYSFVVGFAVEMFVRGVGYFSATTFTLIVCFVVFRMQADVRKQLDRAPAPGTAAPPGVSVA